MKMIATPRPTAILTLAVLAILGGCGGGQSNEASANATVTAAQSQPSLPTSAIPSAATTPPAQTATLAYRLPGADISISSAAINVASSSKVDPVTAYQIGVQSTSGVENVSMLRAVDTAAPTLFTGERASDASWRVAIPSDSKSTPTFLSIKLNDGNIVEVAVAQ